MPTSEELLHAPMLKLERARHHINDLDRQINAYLAERPMRIVIRQEPKLGERTLRIKTEKPIPEHIPRAEDPDEIMFPFAKRSESLGRTMKQRQVKFAGTNVVKLIEDLKPYPATDELLCGLHDLDKRDKHKLVLTVARFPGFTFDELYLIDPTMGSQLGAEGTVRFIPNGDVLYRYPIVGGNRATRRAAPAFEQETNFNPTIAISFSHGLPFEGDLVVPKLVEMIVRAEKVVMRMVAAYLNPTNTFPN